MKEDWRAGWLVADSIEPSTRGGRLARKR